MQYIVTSKAPQAIGPYSQGISVGNFIFTSGQIALKPDGSLNDGDIKVQATQVLTNLSEVLKEAGSSLDKVVKTTIFLSDMDDFKSVNEVYAQFFGSHKPARSTVAVKTLPLGVKVEIEAIALKETL
ncbi:MAG: 2-iminobutanoate/2-iminopropanoate deaminase [Sulfurospirillum sp.]|jgi:2-iminobutanoate/2-iminopropanoate deaminase|nr:2-iminobutanoate/2-iminopropanoate deaminase [Sulfurospirillum sp.]DAB34670.1 MAG TPA: deaminase [Sulfurospirillum sp. UBA12182]